MSLLFPLALAAGAALLYRSRKAAPAAVSNAPLGQQPLQAGVPYLFLVRLPPAKDLSALEAQHEAAIEFLVKKKATLIEFSPATVPPFYAQDGQPWGKEIVSFKATPEGSSTIQRGKPFYELGTLETVARLDGRPFSDPPALV